MFDFAIRSNVASIRSIPNYERTCPVGNVVNYLAEWVGDSIDWRNIHIRFTDKALRFPAVEDYAGRG